ncbi:hypothetical protein EVAR_21976_1 [Eumeta japonica]|uniref:Uncharacterized protein n=1 Tax=Eumeta variegata TaxID=151549 RepID=A0A4C1VVB4_EUMVA|nr:hypothetical protein EVAR_21976_1 [Eumeta japonica]
MEELRSSENCRSHAGWVSPNDPHHHSITAHLLECCRGTFLFEKLHELVEKFERCRVSFSDFCDGRPSTAVKNKNMDAVFRMIETEKYVIYHEIRAFLNTDYARCHRLHNNWQYSGLVQQTQTFRPRFGFGPNQRLAFPSANLRQNALYLRGALIKAVPSF